MQLLSDWLNVKHRLPMIHKGAEDLRVAPWRARRIANMTHGLAKAAAAYVDATLVAVADSCGAVTIDRLVDEARALFDPAQAEEIEDAAKAAVGRAARPLQRRDLGRDLTSRGGRRHPDAHEVL